TGAAPRRGTLPSSHVGPEPGAQVVTPMPFWWAHPRGQGINGNLRDVTRGAVSLRAPELPSRAPLRATGGRWCGDRADQGAGRDLARRGNSRPPRCMAKSMARAGETL